MSPDAEPDHCDVIEGKGSLLHPSYSGVTLSMLNGSQPDVVVICHDPARRTLLGHEQFPLPTVEEIRDLTLKLGARTNPAIRCGGYAINTSALDEAAAAALLDRETARLGLPAADPVRGGAHFTRLVESCLSG
jgi:uncharacterized NAD-dependent epimerase/dehydratase family protein